jgi:hypothetical protein
MRRSIHFRDISDAPLPNALPIRPVPALIPRFHLHILLNDTLGFENSRAALRQRALLEGSLETVKELESSDSASWDVNEAALNDCLNLLSVGSIFWKGRVPAA